MNPQIEQCRDVAISLLRPTPAQLQHGLELHRDSLVVDAYGFAPRAAPDAEVIRRLIDAGASEAEIEWALSDAMMTRAATDPRERAESVATFDAAGVTCVFQNAGEEGNDIPRLLERLGRSTFLVDMMPDVFLRATRPQDIVDAKRRGRRCLYLVANGVPLPNQGACVEEELRYIAKFFQLGVRMMHLTYNRRNRIGDGCAEETDAGLSEFGRAVVKEMNRVGVLVDVAHSGQRTSLEAARASSQPVVASHAACAALRPHVRAKSDEVIRAIADSGGYTGVACVPAFLGRSGDINALLDHVDYLIRTVGADHVAIGTDVAHETSRRASELAKIPQRPRRRPFEYFWPAGDPLFDQRWQHPRMLHSLAWTNWPLFTVGLVQRGHGDETVRKIIGGNVLRVARQVFAASELAHTGGCDGRDENSDRRSSTS